MKVKLKVTRHIILSEQECVALHTALVTLDTDKTFELFDNKTAQFAVDFISRFIYELGK